MGTVLMKKAQAEPDPDKTPADPTLRWIASGKTILNNKGKPVKQFEPYFSLNEHRFVPEEMETEIGVTPILYYDAPGRLVRTELPDGTLSRVEFSPWFVRTFDANDTVLESRWYRERLTTAERGPNATAGSVDEEQKAAAAPPETKMAARLAAQHANTPAETHLDSLGREIIAIAHNKTPSADVAYNNTRLVDRPWIDDYYATFTKLDAEGKPLWMRDARGNLVMQYITPPKPTRLADQPNEDIPSHIDSASGKQIYSAPCYDIAGNLLFQHSMDAGDRWMINDAAGKPMVAWDFNEREDAIGRFDEQRLYYTAYDALHRPTALWLTISDRPTPTPAAPTAQPYVGHAGEMLERFEYQDGLASDSANLNGQLIRHYDPSGLIETVRRDFKGNVREARRTLVADGAVSRVDWQSLANPDGTSKLSSEPFSQITEFDALNRMTRLFNWHQGEGSRVAVYKPAYSARGTLFSEDLVTRATKTTLPDGRDDYKEVADTPAPNPTQGTRTTTAIKAILYNAKNQKTALQLGNGTTTRYTYDENTFRLTHLFTKRVPVDSSDTRFDNDCASNTADDPRPKRPCGVQNLHYTYDPVGNTTHIQDDAQQTIFFDGARVEPSNDYIYDALYRLISAQGRETAQGGDAARDGNEPSYAQGFPVTNQTLRNYAESFVYDSVGNFLTVQHVIQGDSTNSWTRNYKYAFDDPAQPASNRLWQTWTGSDTANATTYAHDTHGNMLNLANTDSRFHVHWDHRDMIRAIDLGGGGQAYYQYDAGKQRSRKIIGRNPPDATSTM
jgi:YD repeat-containing protein